MALTLVSDPLPSAGRESPHSIQAERACLGSVLIRPAALDELADLAVDDFLLPAHREIFDGMRTLATRARAVDVVTLWDELKARGMHSRLEGGESYLLELANAVPTSENVKHYADMVASRAALRRLIAACAEIQSSAHGDISSVEDFLADARQKLAGIELGGVEGPVKIGDDVERVIAEMEARGQNPERFVVATGIRELDKIVTGLFPQTVTIVAANPSRGKCLGLGTPVLRYDGSTVPVEDVKSGDLLMGPDSKPRQVISTARGHGPLFKIVPAKGEPWICNDVHVLTLIKSNAGSDPIDIPLDEFLAKDPTFRERHKLFTVGVDFSPAPALPIDPYFLGVWYGDGSKALKTVVVSKPDQEILNALHETAGIHGCKVTSYIAPGKCPSHRIMTDRGKPNPLLVLMREVVGEGKKLPDAYLTASRTDRASFLAGLLDTDGYKKERGYEIVQRQRGFADGICFLARSLGLGAHMHPKVVNGTTYWRVGIYGDCAFLPLRIPRKKQTSGSNRRNTTRSGFTVESIGEGDYFGFELDGDGRFLLGDFTVTHNTALALNTVIRAAMRGVPCLFFSLEMSRSQIIERALAFKTRINGRLLVSGHLDVESWHKVNAASRSWQQANIPIWIDERVHTASRLCAVARRWRAQRRTERLAAGLSSAEAELAVIAIDYLGMVQGGEEESRRLEVAGMSRAFKRLAKTDHLALILCAQLNRQNMKEATPRQPNLSDLRDAGEIEQDADVVLFPWWDGTPPAGGGPYDAEILVRKNRNGPTGEAPITWEREFMTFSDRPTGHPEERFPYAD